MSRGYVRKDPSIEDSPWVLDEALLIFEEEGDWHYFRAVAHGLGIATSGFMNAGVRQDGSKSWVLWVDRTVGWETVRVVLDQWFEVRE